MATAKEHYQNFLAPYYSWIAGGVEHKLEEFRKFFRDQQIRPLHSKVAVDLGAGPGFQSIPLAEAGFTVFAVDMNRDLLAELSKNAGGMQIVTIEGDLLHFAEFTPADVEIIVCMGDTLTHLQSLEEVRDLLTGAFHALARKGLLVLGFRDLTYELTGADRFIPVRSEPTRIFSCFLEYQENHVRVHDLLYELVGQQWQLRKSVFPKLRIAPQWVKSSLREIGFDIRSDHADKGLVTLVARKP